VRIVVLLAIRNEQMFLGRCLEHLVRQGVEVCVIDNESTDRSRRIAESFLGRGVFRIETLPYNDCFDLPEILRCKERLTKEINADWFIHHDADEIREAPFPYKTLLEGIADADRQGFNAINFDEFVFLPTGEDQSYEGRDYVSLMQYYYFFEPSPLRHVKAWKNNPAVQMDLVNSAGHSIQFEGRRVFPRHFILRHYICLSRAHAISKYGSRVISLQVIKERGWARDRVGFTPDKIRFPDPGRLKRVSGTWDKSDPWVRHESLFGPVLQKTGETAVAKDGDRGVRRSLAHHMFFWSRRYKNG